LHKIVLLGAWVQILIGVFVGMLILYIFYRLFIKKKSISSRNKGWK